MEKFKFRPPGKSLAWKLFASFFACIAVLLLIIWLLNNFVLESYYKSEKEKTLTSSYSQVNNVMLEKYVSSDQFLASPPGEEIQDELYSLATKNGLRILIWQRIPRGNLLVYDSWQDTVGPRELTVVPPDEVKISSYEITYEDDSRSASISIRLFGRIDNGYYIMLTTPMSAITESVGITNRFLLISGAMALAVGLVMVLLITRGFTRPIQKLSHIAAGVARLDFSGRYAGKGEDELAELGMSINHMSEELERSVSELKAANLRLISDIEMKTKQNEAHKAFISNVSHELKTPISLIQTYAEGLREDLASTPEGRDYYCEVIEDEACKMNLLIKKMTMLMQLEAGCDELVIERFDLAELTRNIVIRYHPKFQSAGVQPPEIPDTPLYVWADELLAEHVVSNYLSNALNHTGKDGYIKIDFVMTRWGTTRVTVFNSGSHIPGDDMPNIWTSFYKVDKARTRAYGGTGIGLSVVAAIMKAHRQRYGAANMPGGVSFYAEFDCVNHYSQLT